MCLLARMCVGVFTRREACLPSGWFPNTWSFTVLFLQPRISHNSRRNSESPTSQREWSEGGLPKHRLFLQSFVEGLERLSPVLDALRMAQ